MKKTKFVKCQVGSDTARQRQGKRCVPVFFIISVITIRYVSCLGCHFPDVHIFLSSLLSPSLVSLLFSSIRIFVMLLVPADGWMLHSKPNVVLQSHVTFYCCFTSSFFVISSSLSVSSVSSMDQLLGVINKLLFKFRSIQSGTIRIT